MLEKLYKEKVKLKIVHEAVGDISASDIMLASTTGAMILGFNAYTGPKEASLADSLGVQIRNYRVIYDMIEEMQRMMEGVLEPIVKEVVIGKAEVRKLFKISKVGIVAGCYVQEGRVRRGERARVLRGAEVLHEGKILSLRRFKDDVTEVAQGFECGLRVEGFEEYREGDLIEVVSLQREER
jgi:translation initiation factor IF-2